MAPASAKPAGICKVWAIWCCPHHIFPNLEHTCGCCIAVACSHLQHLIAAICHAPSFNARCQRKQGSLRLSLAGGEAGPTNIEEPRAEARRKTKAGGIPSRPLPVAVCKEVIQALAKQERWTGWAFDGRKNIYTAKPIMDINQTHDFQVCYT